MAKQRIYRSTYPPPYCPTNLSISQFLVGYNPDAVPADKLILEDDWTSKSFTYQGLRDAAAEHAHSLREKYNLNIGDVVAISGANSGEHVLLIHSVLWAGATACLINPLSTKDDFVHYFGICKPKIVVVDDELYDVTIAALGKSAYAVNPKVILLGRKSQSKDVAAFPSDFTSRQKLPAFDLSRSDNRVHTAIVCFSSGTSGKPKGVELSHYNLISSLAGIRSSDPVFYNAESRGVFFAPLCHIYGLNTVGLMGMWLGSYTILMKKYSLDALLKISTEKRINTLRIVPPIALAMTKLDALHSYDLSSVKFILCSGAALQKEVIEVLQRKLNGAPIFQGYGMTETNISTLRSHEWGRVGSVGRLMANVEARIVDDDLIDVEEGKDGEMLIRGPSVFRQYMNDPVATEQTFHDGWMRTGDVLHIDPDGFLYLTDRKKELIKYKGFQVAPAELEGILTSHPFVNEGVVCATWDRSQGTEVPMAYITLSRAGLDYNGPLEKALSEISSFVNAKVSPYKRLRGGVEVLNEIPKTATGKILRRLLPARLAMSRTAKL